MHTTAPRHTGQMPVAPKKRRVPVWAWIVSGIAAMMLLYGVNASLAGTDSPAPIPNSSAGASSKNVFHYGQTAAVGKFAVTLTPIDYTPSEGRAESGTATAFQVTVRNDGQGTLDLFSLMFRATIDGGQPADQIFDSGKGIKGAPSGELFPSESATFRIAFDGTVARVKVEEFLGFSSPVYFVS